MIVCHCKAVNDRAIRDAVRSGACSRRQIALACAAGRTCGGCVPTIESILADELAEAAAPDAPFDRAASG